VCISEEIKVLADGGIRTQITGERGSSRLPLMNSCINFGELVRCNRGNVVENLVHVE
jgi:hypothetical protein